jgi:hypothetical protein
MTQNAIFADIENVDPEAAPGIGTQLLALGSAACVGLGLFFGSIVLGVALFVVVLVTMNVDAGQWVTSFRTRVLDRNCPVFRRLGQPAVIR